MREKIFLKWITESPKVILQNALITREGLESTELKYEYGKIWYELSEGYWLENKFVGDNNAVGWMKHPKPFKK